MLKFEVSIFGKDMFESAFIYKIFNKKNRLNFGIYPLNSDTSKEFVCVFHYVEEKEAVSISIELSAAELKWLSELKLNSG